MANEQTRAEQTGRTPEGRTGVSRVAENGRQSSEESARTARSHRGHVRTDGAPSVAITSPRPIALARSSTAICIPPHWSHTRRLPNARIGAQRQAGHASPQRITSPGCGDL